MSASYGPSVVAGLLRLHSACLARQVSYSVHYNEHDGSWYARIDSAAPSERYVSKDYSDLSWCIECAITHLGAIA